MTKLYSKSKPLPVYDVNGSDFMKWSINDWIAHATSGDKVAMMMGPNRHGEFSKLFAPTPVVQQNLKGFVGNMTDTMDESGFISLNVADFGFASIIMKYDEIPEFIRPEKKLEEEHLLGTKWDKMTDVAVALVPIACPVFFGQTIPASISLFSENSVDTIGQLGDNHAKWAEMITEAFKQYKDCWGKINTIMNMIDSAGQEEIDLYIRKGFALNMIPGTAPFFPTSPFNGNEEWEPDMVDLRKIFCKAPSVPVPPAPANQGGATTPPRPTPPAVPPMQPTPTPTPPVVPAATPTSVLNQTPVPQQQVHYYQSAEMLERDTEANLYLHQLRLFFVCADIDWEEKSATNFSLPKWSAGMESILKGPVSTRYLRLTNLLTTVFSTEPKGALKTDPFMTKMRMTVFTKQFVTALLQANFQVEPLLSLNQESNALNYLHFTKQVSDSESDCQEGKERQPE